MKKLIMPKTEGNTSVAVKKSLKLQAPKKYAVIIYNDDYSTFEFVIKVLSEIFNKSYEEAKIITTAVHKSGKGVAGIYLLEIANAKVKQVEEMAKLNHYPLQCKIEETK
jgi:ATP-dependent Clp protease adaptor protein ClpS